MVGDLLISKSAPYRKGFLEKEAGKIWSILFLGCVPEFVSAAVVPVFANALLLQLDPRRFVIFGLQKNESVLAYRWDWRLYRDGPAERTFVPRAAKLARPKEDTKVREAPIEAPKSESLRKRPKCPA